MRKHKGSLSEGQQPGGYGREAVQGFVAMAAPRLKGEGRREAQVVLNGKGILLRNLGQFC